MFINESFLSFIWQFQYFNKNQLLTDTGELLEIFHPGIRNSDEGPDFSAAKIRIGEVTWFGNVEIHVQSSQWVMHHHEGNPKYGNVVLHVVWMNDRDIKRADGTLLPTLSLKERIHNDQLLKFHWLVNSQDSIPCSRSLPVLDEIRWTSMLDRLMVERLERKCKEVDRLYQLTEHSWEETSYRMLARNFGFKINQEEMLLLATSLPFRLVQKNIDHPLRIEALLFGVAGFLREKAKDEYHQELIREYQFLRDLYGLADGFLKRTSWKFMRTHPANFPPLRIAQLAWFLTKIRNLFSFILETSTASQVYKTVGTFNHFYWKYHYDFGKKIQPANQLGKHSINILIINTFLPLVFYYGKIYSREDHVRQAMDLVSGLPAETNSVIRKWASFHVKSANAFSSQALLQLYYEYCLKKRCLHCNIGVSILQRGNHVLAV